MKNSNDTIGNRTRDLLTCGTVPQPTAPPRIPIIIIIIIIIVIIIIIIIIVSVTDLFRVIS
jgi:amino acid transporter